MSYDFRGNTHSNTTQAPQASRPAAAAPPRSAAPSSSVAGRSLSQILALVFGITFLLVGILGFIPGITSNYSELSLLGTDSDAHLLGLFRVSILHNIVHMLFGVGILAAARPASARLYLLGGGAAYVLVAAYGFIVEESSGANFLPVNHADNLLHVVLALALLGAGLVSTAIERKSAH